MTLKVAIHVFPAKDTSSKYIEVSFHREQMASDVDALTLLQDCIQKTRASGNVKYILLTLNCDLLPDELIELAKIFLGEKIYLKPDDHGNYNGKPLNEFRKLVAALHKDTVINLNPAFCWSYTESILKVLRPGTVLGIPELPKTRMKHGLCIQDLVTIILSPALPHDIILEIRGNYSQEVSKKILQLCAQERRTLRLYSSLRTSQLQWLEAYAPPGLILDLPKDVEQTAALNMLNGLKQANQRIKLPSKIPLTILYHLITALKPEQRCCAFEFEFDYALASIDNAKGMLMHFKQHLKAGDTIRMPDVTSLPPRLDLFFHGIPNDVTFTIETDNYTAETWERLLSAMPATHILRLPPVLSAETLTIIKHYANSALCIEFPRQIHPSLIWCIFEAFNNSVRKLKMAPGINKELLYRIITMIPPDQPRSVIEFEMPTDNAYQNLSAFDAVYERRRERYRSECVRSGDILRIPRNLHVSNLSFLFHAECYIRFSSDLLPDSAIAIACKLAEVNSPVTIQLTADLSIDWLEAFLKDVAPNCRIMLAPDIKTSIEATIKHIINSQRKKFIIELPAHILPCTPDMMRSALTKLRCSIQLHPDTSMTFGKIVATALPNNVALMLPLSLGADTAAVIAIARALKPGNSLYVQTLTDDLLTAIPALQPQVTLLLNIETMTQQDAITMIKLLPPGCILGLVVSKEQRHDEEIQGTYQQCVLHLPKGCILKVAADMGLEFILSLEPYLPDITALLVPKTFPSASDHTWLAQIASILTTTISFQTPFSNTSIADSSTGAYDIMLIRTLILPPDISKEAVDYLIDHLPDILWMVLPHDLVLSTEQRDKLDRPGIRLFSQGQFKLDSPGINVSGTLGFPADMSPLDVQAITQRWQRPLPEPRPDTSAITSSSQTSSLFTPASPKRATPEPGTVSSTEPAAKRQR